MLGVLRKVDEGRCEVGARDAVRTVGEVLPPGLRSNPARLRPVREIRRSGDSPVGPTPNKEGLPSSGGGIGVLPKTAGIGRGTRRTPVTNQNPMAASSLKK